MEEAGDAATLATSWERAMAQSIAHLPATGV
jgi:hypothetical protein